MNIEIGECRDSGTRIESCFQMLELKKKLGNSAVLGDSSMDAVWIRRCLQIEGCVAELEAPSAPTE